MNAEALTAMASGPANAAAQGQHKKVSQKESQPRTSSCCSAFLPASQKPSSTSLTTTTSQTKDGFPTHKVIMTDRTTSLIMLLFIMAMFPAIFAGLARVGISWKAALGGAVCCCVAVTVSISVSRLRKLLKRQAVTEG